MKKAPKYFSVVYESVLTGLAGESFSRLFKTFQDFEIHFSTRALVWFYRVN